MAARGSKASTQKAQPPEPAAPPPPSEAAALDVKALAEGILARTIRPRAADVRRLAEAVVKKGKKKGKKADGKKRKLSKIPGQKRAK